jgi:Family of unknown function (DUF5715)
LPFGASAARLLLLFLVFSNGCREKTQTIMSAPETAGPATVDPWKEAALKVEEDRGEPTGRQVRLDVPAQLKQYVDSRRFLSVQIAEWRQQKLQIPHDFADLATLIRKGELVEVPPLGNAYILYGVGMMASEEPFTHYDKESGKSVPLFGSDAELQQEYDQISTSLAQLREALTRMKRDLKETPRRDRALRKQLQSEVNENEKSTSALKNRKNLLESFYQNPKSREVLAAEYEALAAFARDFGKPAYDLKDPVSRKALKVRLLSYLRPAALRVLEDLAQLYQNKFGRALAVTSLIRTEEYQRQLHTSNPNATLIEVPPHSTGLAFDVYYRYMSAAEQEFIMAELARLYDEGKIEVLRENINHFHIFAFMEGRRPDEELIKRSLAEVAPEPAKPPKRSVKPKPKTSKKHRAAR